MRSQKNSDKFGSSALPLGSKGNMWILPTPSFSTLEEYLDHTDPVNNKEDEGETIKDKRKCTFVNQ